MSKEKLDIELARDKLQIKVYDAIENLHKKEWGDSSLGTEALL